jgi:hypothetical protein
MTIKGKWLRGGLAYRLKWNAEVCWQDSNELAMIDIIPSSSYT